MPKKIEKLEDSKEKLSDKFIGVFSFEFDEKKGAAGVQSIPDTIHLIPVGKWDHDAYGPIIVTASDIKEFEQNFNAGIRKGVFITAGHEGFQELPAVGWVMSVEARGDGLWGRVEWNENGKEMLGDKQYKFFSPEFFREYEDPETHAIYRNVITGGALTKSPYFKELEAIVFSEKILNNNFKEKTMSIKDIMAKKKGELTAEEKAFIKKHTSELTDDQKKEYAEVIEPDGDEDDAEEAKKEEEENAKKEGADKKKKASENAGEADAETVVAPVVEKTPDEIEAETKSKEEADKKVIEDENLAKGLNADGSAKVEGSEKVQITASELVALRKKAEDGAKAFAELRTNKINQQADALLFSETNKVGKFLPKSKVTLRYFMEKLNDSQRALFTSLMAELPNANIFSELGVKDGATEGTAEAEVEAKVSKKMSENKDMKYAKAMKEVFEENKGLSERYNEEVKQPAAKV